LPEFLPVAKKFNLKVFPKVLNQTPTLEYCQDVNLITLVFCRLRINPKTLLKNQKTQNNILYPCTRAQAQLMPAPQRRRSVATASSWLIAPRRQLCLRPGAKQLQTWFSDFPICFQGNSSQW
jgi:hypothetical protein